MQFKVCSFRCYIKGDPADDRLLRTQHDLLEAFRVQSRFKDSVVFFVMFKERFQFAILHPDPISIQTYMIPEFIVFPEKLVNKFEFYLVTDSVGDADLKGDLLKAFLKTALIVYLFDIIDHFIRLNIFTVENDVVGKSVYAIVQFAAFSIVSIDIFYAFDKAVNICQDQCNENDDLHDQRSDKHEQQYREYCQCK